MKTNFLSRKFLLTVAFMAIICLNAAFKWGIAWQDIVALGLGIGVYSLSNAYKAVGEAETVTRSIYEDKAVLSMCNCDIPEAEDTDVPVGGTDE